jgi:predicted ATP-dependent serine protease
MSERTFVCLDCGARTESFLEPCPECDSTQFESTTDYDDEETEEPLTRPVNPIAPAAGD